MLIKKHALLFIFLIVASKLQAQLCKGSLGDPIINITFGAGANPGPVLTTTQNLNYISADCPNDGSYTVRNNTSRCFNNTWHTLNSDHTGDANGYFMLINASLQKSEFYVDTLKGLCPSTTYEFAAWVLNVIVPSACLGNTIKPNLTFNIEKTDGTVLQTYNTGDISAISNPTWNQYGFFFTTPSSVSNVILRILNNSTGGCGNDIAIDDITFRPCGPLLTPSIKGIPGKVKELCEGANTDLTLQCEVSAGYNNPTILWQESRDGGTSWIDIPGETTTSLERRFTSTSRVGEYLYRLTVGEASNAGLSSCRVASAVLTVRINRNPVTAISSNSPVCAGTAIVLSAVNGLDGEKYEWSGINSFSGTGSSITIQNARMVDAGKYFLRITSAVNCQHTDSASVIITPAPVIKTAFTNKTICRGEEVVLGSSGGDSFLWSPAASLSSPVIADPIARPVVTTIYTVVAANSSSCKDSATVTITVNSKPLARAGPDKAIVEGQSVQLDGIVGGSNTSISWFPDVFIDSPHSIRPIVSPVTSTAYVLTVKSNDGCGISIDTANVVVYKKVIIPTAFSPNADGINDTWNIRALAGYNNYDLSVFNRYGAVVFNTRNYDRPWDGSYGGKPLPVGTYYYLLDLKLGLPKLKGFVVIVR